MQTYISTNTENGKFYIGSTTDFNRRKQEHLRSTCNRPFQNALRNSPDKFEWKVWSDDLEEPVLEQALLDMWFGTEQCYNLNPSAYTLQVTGEDLKKAGCRGGCKLRDLCSGIHAQTVEDRIYLGTQTWLEGKGIHDPKNREKVREGQEKGHLTVVKKYSKPVKCIESGEIYSSANEASRQTGLPQGGISNSCKYGWATKGTHWIYAEV